MPSCKEEDVDKLLDNMFSNKYDKLFYKWLSPNDYLWAEKKNIHQSGILIPRESLNFFGISRLPTNNKTFKFKINWFLYGKSYTRKDVKYTQTNVATIKYYIGGNRSSRPETHLTNVYNPYFKDLKYGPLFLIARIPGKKYSFDAIIIDNDILIETVFKKLNISKGSSYETLSVIESQTLMDFNLSKDLYNLLFNKSKTLYNSYKKIPSTKITSNAVWNILKQNDIIIKNNFKLRGLSQSKKPFNTVLKRTPGNLTRWALTKVEYQLVKLLEKIHYPAIISNILKNNTSKYPSNWKELTLLLEKQLHNIVDITIGITNSRRSRAGYSFEWHIYNLLRLLDVNFERQAGNKRIDFKIQHNHKEINLSAKTSTRERWKQIYEGSYFITLEKRISKRKLERIKKRNIKLIIPEEDMNDINYYQNNSYIITFREFLYEELN